MEKRAHGQTKEVQRTKTTRTRQRRLQLKISPALSAQRATTTNRSMSEITEAALQEYLEEW
jgi:hypothetical protein